MGDETIESLHTPEEGDKHVEKDYPASPIIERHLSDLFIDIVAKGNSPEPVLTGREMVYYSKYHPSNSFDFDTALKDSIPSIKRIKWLERLDSDVNVPDDLARYKFIPEKHQKYLIDRDKVQEKAISKIGKQAGDKLEAIELNEETFNAVSVLNSLIKESKKTLSGDKSDEQPLKMDSLGHISKLLVAGMGWTVDEARETIDLAEPYLLKTLYIQNSENYYAANPNIILKDEKKNNSSDSIDTII